MQDRSTGRRSKQRGVALIMTLGILALLLIMAMSFAYTSKTNQMSAGISADITQARLMTESGVSRLLAAMKTTLKEILAGSAPEEAVYPPTAFYPPTAYFSRYAPTGQYYMVSTDASHNDDGGLLTALVTNGIPPAVYPLLSGTARWVHVEQDIDRNGTDELTGRFGYLVLDESGKIDATAAATPDWEPFHLDSLGVRDSFFDIDNDGDLDGFDSPYSVTNISKQRYGASLAELTIDDQFRDELPFSCSDLNGDGNSDRARWFSLQHLVNGRSSGFPPAEYLTYAADSYDIEAFTDWTTKTDYHRFDMTGVFWNPDRASYLNGWEAISSWTGLEKVTWLASAHVGFWVDPSATPRVVNLVDGVANKLGDPGGISCLDVASPRHLDFGSDPYAADRRREMIANLIDYSDSDNIPTAEDTDADGHYNFVGLEKSPYVNEVSFDIKYRYEPPDLAAVPPTTGTGTFEVWPFVELANPYDTAYDVTVSIAFTMTVDYTGTPGPVPSDAPPGGPTVYTETSATVNALEHSYTPVMFTLTDFPKTWTGLWNEDIPVKITNVSVMVSMVTGMTDYAFCYADDPALPIQHTFQADPVGVDYYTSIEVNDPRCNTWPAEWTPISPSFGTSLLTDASMGRKNTLKTTPDGLYPDPDTDAGDLAGAGVDPAISCPDDGSGISTGFIRNAPMRSLWELGAIHRAKAWCTIDLKSYTDGDAKLLSECKIGPWTVAPGKVNANSPSPNAWNVLLQNLEVDDRYDDVDAGSSSLPATLVSEMASLPPAAPKRCLERGELVDYVTDMVTTAGTGASNDRGLESTIGRLANILTVRQNYFTVIVVGQSVKELTGDVPSLTALAADDPDDDVYEFAAGRFCRVLAEQKIVATIYRDALHNRFRIERIEYMEE